MNLTRLFDVDDTRFKGMKDAELISLIATQDHDALAYVMCAYYRYVNTIFLKYGWNSFDAEELTQDVFIHLHKYAVRIIETNPGWKLGSMFGFLAKRLGSRREEFNRKKKRNGITISADAPMDYSMGEESRTLADTFVDARPLQDSAILVAEVLDAIPADMRPLLERYVFDDATGRELAQDIQVSQRTVFSRIYATLRRAKSMVVHQPILYSGAVAEAPKFAAPDPSLGFVRVPVHNPPPAPKVTVREKQMAETQQIAKMREQGMTYPAIATALNLTVKAVSGRHYYNTKESVKAKNRDWHARAYAKVVQAELALERASGAVTRTFQKKRAASVGLEGMQRQRQEEQ